MTKIIPVILSGGSGTRLWPASRPSNPKQFMDFFGELSLFRQSLARINSEVSFEDPIIIANQEHRFLIMDELRKAKINAQAIILEPISRNTYPAITIAAIYAKSIGKESSLLLVMPSDHIIRNQEKFLEQIYKARQPAIDGKLLTFGISPNKPETGYGYIKRSNQIPSYPEIYEIERFVEKPDLDKAKEFLASGEYLWNSGIFMFSAKAFLEESAAINHEYYSLCEESYNNSYQDLYFTRLEESSFSACPNISIDYAIMEKSNNTAVTPLDVGWSDIGSWDSIYEISNCDHENNAIFGKVIALSTNNCYINSKDILIATIGVSNLLIVTTKDAVLIANRGSSQDVKTLFEKIKDLKLEEGMQHRKSLRPWGSFEVIDMGERFKAKKITVNPHSSLSLQLHNFRAEHWVVVKGKAIVTCGEQKFIVSEDQSTYIPINTKHRLENVEDEPLELIEIQTGDQLIEEDIVRYEDNYGR